MKVLLLASIGMFSLCVNASAQNATAQNAAAQNAPAPKVNTDSLKLISRISADQLELGKLQNSVEQKTRNKEDGAVAAQQSADKNATAATRLSNNPQNKQDARQADNAAGDARSNARKARKAADQLDKVNKNIADLQTRIAKEQEQLRRYTGTTYLPATPIIAVQPDSTQHN